MVNTPAPQQVSSAQTRKPYTSPGTTSNWMLPLPSSPALIRSLVTPLMTNCGRSKCAESVVLYAHKNAMVPACMAVVE
jgi:hypothetical protein